MRAPPVRVLRPEALFFNPYLHMYLLVGHVAVENAKLFCFTFCDRYFSDIRGANFKGVRCDARWRDVHSVA